MGKANTEGKHGENAGVTMENYRNYNASLFPF